MDWFTSIFSFEVLSLIIPIILIISVFVFATIRAQHRHNARIEKVKYGFNPYESTSKSKNQ